MEKPISELIEDLKQKWPNYEKWTHLPMSWWVPDERVQWPRFDGKGVAKGPYIKFSGRKSVEPPDSENLAKMINNTWMNTYFMLWKVLHDELGREKADELVGYSWLTQVTQMVGLIKKFDDKDRNCVILSKVYQQECYIEGNDIDVVEETPKRTQIRLLCNFWRHVVERWKSKGIGHDKGGMCEACIAFHDYFGRAIHPKAACTHTAHPLDTGTYCEFVWEMDE